MEDGLFPHSRTVDHPEELEEERRLCYVGLTRAMQRLYLVRARRRRFQGETMQTRPSRFLKEVPAELLAGRRGLGVGNLVRRYGLGDDSGGLSRPNPVGRPGLSRPDAGGLQGTREGSTGSLGGGLGGGTRSPLGGGSTPGRGFNPSFKNLIKPLATAPPAAAEDDEEEATPAAPRSRSGEGGPFSDLQVGRRVQHPSFGEGVIREREGPPDNPRLTIAFKTSGTKKLMARFAPLELVYR
jgi:DNA helicase-2/ATP-dependent DNA helicase PcrA